MEHPIRIDPDEGLIIISSNISNKDKYECLKDHWFFTIPGFDNYSINRDGKVYGKNNNRLFVDKCYYKLLRKGQKHYHKTYELVIKTFDPHTTNKYFRIYFINNDKTNYKLNNLIQYDNFNEALSVVFPDSMQINNSNYYINLIGQIYNFNTDRLLKINTSRGYRYTSINNKRTDIHKELAKAYIPIPERLKKYNINDLVVHHKDNNPLNNTIDLNDLYGIGTNLQWMTRSEHTRHHCQKYGPILLKDIFSQKVTIYDTINDIVNMMNYPRSTIQMSIKRKLILSNKYQIKYDDGLEWPKVKYYIGYNVITGEVKRCYNRYKLSNYVKLCDGVIGRYMNTDHITKTGWKFKTIEI